MDICNGKCTICSEDTLVLSGKDKQKFVDLLKEHYFDANQIKDNKFLLQFKEKRSRKSICMSCAYIIESYVTARNKFKELTRPDNKCSICKKESNLTNGTNKLIEDARNLLKNVHENKKIRLKHICLQCCFCIISWSKIENIISEYTQSEEEDSNTLNGLKKRRYSAVDSESDSSKTSNIKNKLPARRTRRSTINIERVEDISRNTKADKQNKSKNTSSRNKKKLKLTKTATDELEEQLKHLCNVSTEVISKDIYLSDKMASKVISDDKMMFGIAYISFETKKLTSKSKSINVLSDTEDINLESRRTSIKSESKTSIDVNSLMKSNKKKRKNNSPNLKSQSETLDNNSNSSEVTENKKRRCKKKSKIEDVILISDAESDTCNLEKNNSDNKTALRVSSRVNKGKFTRYTPNRKIVKSEPKKNECSSCNKSFVRKYRLQLHELEHEASFKPVVVVQKEDESNQETNYTKKEDNQNKKSQKDNGLEKTYKNDTFEKKTDSNDNEKGSDKDDSDETQFDETIKQVVNATLSQLDKDITEDSPEEKNDDQEQSLDLHANDELSQDEDPLKLNDVSVEKDKITDGTKENEINNEEDNCNINEENEKVNAESDSVEENSKSKNQPSTIESDSEETLNKDSKNETDETGQQLDNEKSDLTDKMNEENPEDSSQGNNEENKNDTEIQTNEEANDNNCDKAISEKCDTPNQESTNDCTVKENSAAVEKKTNSNVVNVIDSDEENDEQKTASTKNLKTLVIEDDSSNSSEKIEEIIGEKKYESVVIEDDSSEGEDNLNYKTARENNHESIVTQDDCSNSSDKREDIEKEKSVEENHLKTVVIEDDSSNKFAKNEENEIQNSEELHNESESLFSEDLQTNSNDEDPLDNGQNTENSDNIEKKSKNESKPTDESEDANSQSTDKTSKSFRDDESDMGSLRISPESVHLSPKKHNELITNTISNSNSDKFDMVENLLQNLGA